MQLLAQKPIFEKEERDIANKILRIFQEKRLSFRQASDILDMLQIEMYKLPITDGYTVEELMGK